MRSDVPKLGNNVRHIIFILNYANLASSCRKWKKLRFHNHCNKMVFRTMSSYDYIFPLRATKTRSSLFVSTIGSIEELTRARVARNRYCTDFGFSTRVCLENEIPRQSGARDKIRLSENFSHFLFTACGIICCALFILT